jgi:hypothetical protein
LRTVRVGSRRNAGSVSNEATHLVRCVVAVEALRDGPATAGPSSRSQSKNGLASIAAACR